MRLTKPILIGLFTLVLAGSAGFLTATALSQEAEPVRTVTIEVGTGEQGPAGPPGPAGPAGPPGGQSCPSGFSFGEVVFIQQGKGPTTLFTCLKD